jgi:acyl transferase domain-containing protein
MDTQRKQEYNSFHGIMATDIAIIGMAGHFPQSPDIHTFWENLKNGRDCISENQRFLCDEVPEARWGGFIDGIDWFDHDFFNVPEEDARHMDPRQRLFLQTAWHALEDSGYGGSRLYGSRTGVLVGCANNQYQETFYQLNIKQKNALLNSNASIANRFSYFMNFKGPSLVLASTCSSSATAVHLACQSLKNNECTMAITGGIDLLLSPEYFIALSRMGVLAKSGKTCALGGQANGFVPGEGVGAVVLKPLQQALQDQDYIYGIIKGTGLNYSGHTRHLTSPNPYAQVKLVTDTLQRFHIQPSTLRYIEVNGSAIGITDALEVQALAAAFAKMGVKQTGFCALGTVKNNIGNLDSACCLAALIKAVLSLKHRQIPPVIHVNPPNRLIKINNTPFFINETLQPYQDQGHPLRAGIQSLGIGGANAFMIVEEPPPKAQRQSTPTPAPRHHSRPGIVNFSARNQDSLKRLLIQMENHLNQHHEEVEFADICHTCSTGRGHFEHRVAIVCSSTQQLLAKLRHMNRTFPQPPDNEAGIFITSNHTTNHAKKIKEKKPSFLKLFLENQKTSSGKITLEEDNYINPIYNPRWSPTIIFVFPEMEPGPAGSLPLADYCHFFKEALKKAGDLFSPDTLKEISGAKPGIMLQTTAALTLISWGIKPQKILAQGTGFEAAAGIANMTDFPIEVVEIETTEPPGDLKEPEPMKIFISMGAVPPSLENCSDSYLCLDLLDLDAPPGEHILSIMAILYIQGTDIDWVSFAAVNPGEKIPLPQYPFKPYHYWLGD